ncbi:hypothetical protein ACFL2V_18265 [Pseudomonadota bacterium]
MGNNHIDFSKVIEWSDFTKTHQEDVDEAKGMYQEAKNFLEFYDWCLDVNQSYIGILHPGILGVFLFRISPSNENVDEWIWVLVGDIPPAYLTTEECPNPACALDGYIGAMEEWVDAVEKEKPIDKLIPVNVAATKENGERLKKRLAFLDKKVLPSYSADLQN